VPLLTPVGASEFEQPVMIVAAAIRTSGIREQLRNDICVSWLSAAIYR
jgi:hypothetical protein